MEYYISYKKTFFVILLAMCGFYIFSNNANASILAQPDISLSSYNLFQADTLLVVVKNESGQISGNLGTVKMRFFRSENNKDWVSIVGIPINKKPGIYKVIINVPGKAIFKKDISVLKRNFPITKMIITPELEQKGYTPKSIVNNIENKENKMLNQVLNNITKEVYISKPFIYPLSLINIVGPFGDIRASKNYKIQHLGVDLKAAMGTPIYAVNDGKVVFVETMTDYGKTIIIDHGLGVYSLYLHLSDFKVAVGQIVRQGDVIGLSGDTGYVTGPHLHFSMKIRGASIDPLKFIQATQTQW